MSDCFARVDITQEAKALLDTLIKEHGELIFHQSGGCCDGSVPMCIIKSEFYLGSSDLHIGDIHNCGFFMHSDNYEYFKNTHITLDVQEGRASSFSLEGSSGFRFVTHQRLFTKEEEQNLFKVQ